MSAALDPVPSISDWLSANLRPDWSLALHGDGAVDLEWEGA